MNFIRGSAAPGVHDSINNALVGGPAQTEASDIAFFVVYSTWGPVNEAKTITGLDDYTRTFGMLHPNSHGTNAVHNFYRQGGRICVVRRVTGPAAAVATLTLLDRADPAVATLRVDQRYPSLTVDVRVKVENGTEPNTFKLTFRSVRMGSVLPAEV